jgi:archaemetzincin
MATAFGSITILLLILSASIVFSQTEDSPIDISDFDIRSASQTVHLEGRPAIYFMVMKGVDSKPIEEIASMFSESFLNIPVIILDESPDMPQDAYVDIRDKYYAGKLLEDFAKYKPPNSVALVIFTDKDIYVGRWSFVRGIGDPETGVAIVSTFRLKEAASSYRLEVRMLKEALHEAGHAIGLKHCDDNYNCVMGLSSGLGDLDNKVRTFCNFHMVQIRKFLIEKGIDPSIYALPQDDATDTVDKEKDK